MPDPHITVVAPGIVRVEAGGRQEIVYVAGPPANRWAFWNGHVFHWDGQSGHESARLPGGRFSGPQSLMSPMPATVIKVPVAVGSHVLKGDTLVVLEAMKMEWPVRSIGDGTVKALHCREGELVRGGQLLVELEAGDQTPTGDRGLEGTPR